MEKWEFSKFCDDVEHYMKANCLIFHQDTALSTAPDERYRHYKKAVANILLSIPTLKWEPWIRWLTIISCAITLLGLYIRHFWKMVRTESSINISLWSRLFCILNTNNFVLWIGCLKIISI
jgi:hypothetical protein